MVCGVWCVVCCVVCGVWCGVVCVVWCVAYGVWCGVCGVMVCGVRGVAWCGVCLPLQLSSAEGGPTVACSFENSFCRRLELACGPNARHARLLSWSGTQREQRLGHSWDTATVESVSHGLESVKASTTHNGCVSLLLQRNDVIQVRQTRRRRSAHALLARARTPPLVL
jgi:hypothetical protein